MATYDDNPLVGSDIQPVLLYVEDASGNLVPLKGDGSNNLLMVQNASGSSASQLQGNVAHDATDSGNPIKIGGKASSTAPSDVGSGDRVNAWWLLNGALATYDAYLRAGEDLTNNVQKVEHQYTSFSVTGDTLVKSGVGFIHTITISPTTASPTAGLLTIYDATSETGTVLYSGWVFATDPARTIVLDCRVATGIYVGYDGTLANVRVSGSYR